MAVAGLFSLASFALNASFLDKEMTTGNSGTTYDTATGELVLPCPDNGEGGTHWDAKGWAFEGNEVRDAGFTGVEFKYEILDGTSKFRVMVTYEDKFGERSTDDSQNSTGHYTFALSPDKDLAVREIRISTSDGQPVTFLITMAEFIDYKGAVAPVNFTNPIDFEDNNFRGYQVKEAAWGAVAKPITHMGTESWGGWAPDGVSYSVVADPDDAANTCLFVTSGVKSSDKDAQLYYYPMTYFHIKLPVGNTFGNVKKLKFNVKCADYGVNSEYPEEAYDEDGNPILDDKGNPVLTGNMIPVYNKPEQKISIAVADKSFLLTGRTFSAFYKDKTGKEVGDTYGQWFVTFPLAYRSFDPVFIGDLGVWNTITVDVADFWDWGKNQAMWQGYYEEGEPGYLGTLNEFQIGIGLNSGGFQYYLDNIEFELGPVSVKDVVAESVSSVKVYAIQGGLAIEGAEKAIIYGIDGSLVAIATGTIALPKGVYIVKADNQVVKAIVK